MEPGSGWRAALMFVLKRRRCLEGCTCGAGISSAGSAKHPTAGGQVSVELRFRATPSGKGVLF